ncbi:ABC transporter permease, partial [Kibdelosporangium lantanae]
IGAVVGEFTGADKGLGLLINRSQGTFDAAGIYAGMIVITVIALLAEWLLTLVENRLLKWRPPVASAAGCNPNGNPLPTPHGQSYWCGGYWDNYNFLYEDADGHCYFFDWWWNILACAGGPSHRGTAVACE